MPSVKDVDPVYPPVPDDQPVAKPVSTGRTSAPTEPTKSEVKVKATAEDEKPQSYVWLANGEVILAYNEDLPGAAGSNAPNGHWVKDGKVHQIVAVYDKEEKAEE